MGIRDKLDALNKALPDEEVAEFHDIAEAQRKKAQDPFANVSEIERDRLRKSLRVGEAELDRGEGMSANEARKRLRSM